MLQLRFPDMVLLMKWGVGRAGISLRWSGGTAPLRSRLACGVYYVALSFILLVMVGPLQAAVGGEASETKPKKIVLIAGKKSHGPGVHEYLKSVRLLKAMLDTSPNLQGFVTEYHLDGWPEDPTTLEDADTIMTISDGQDGELYSPVPFMTPDRMEVMRRQMARGCGFITFHFSTFAPDDMGKDILEWGGGYFDWQDDTGARNWYSAIKTLDTDVELASPVHPINRGLRPFKLREEYYYKIRFKENDPRLTPIWNIPALDDGSQDHMGVVAWAVERADGGRGFGTTTGHFYDNWQVPEYRKMILNAIVWSTGADVPQGGVASRNFDDEAVATLLDDQPIRALILTGHHHPAHDWRKTTPVLKAALEQDPRMRGNVDVTQDIEALATAKLTDYDLLVMNYCNWERPGLSEAGKQAFTTYLKNGGGLVLVHFANGAFHYSLPGAAESDWPEYRKICRRVWDHKADSGHDPYGPFTVKPTDHAHEITRGISAFETTDELYFKQKGDEPIQPLIQARSKVTDRDEPLAWAYNYGEGRVFQTVLGHDAPSLKVAGVAQLIRRGAVWAADREQVELGPQAVRLTATLDAAPLETASSTKKNNENKLIDEDDVLAAPPGLDAGLGGHWGVKNDADWVDDRVNDMAHGPTIACSLDTPTGMVTKALVIRVGDQAQGAMCFDTGTLTMCAGWTGGYIKFGPTRFGLIDRPVIDGEVRFTANASTQASESDQARYKVTYLSGDRVVLSYEMNAARILDAPWLETHAGQSVFTRAIEVTGQQKRVTIPLVFLSEGDVAVPITITGCTAVAYKHDKTITLIAMRGGDSSSLDMDAAGVRLKMDSQNRTPSRADAWVWSGEEGSLQAVARSIGVAAGKSTISLHSLIENDKPRWGEAIVTQGLIAPDDQPYVIDTVTVPHGNRHRAPMFLSGVDFFLDSPLDDTPADAAVCTVHGDVWLVSGLDAELDRIEWRRFATGLYQPLGLRIIDNQVYVIGRDRITRLIDRNGDGEADEYESYFGGIETSPNGHQYVAGLEIDTQGRFLYVDPKGLHRVEADGSAQETLAAGWRNPIALGVTADGAITVAPQEGEWTPASMICEVKVGGYYGYGGPRVSPDRPIGYDRPLVYLPRQVDNSTADQLEVTSERWGPLRGKLLNLSFGASSMQLVLRDRVDGTPQGAVVPLTGRFLSGAMRGRFRPEDGQLYVAGSTGWVTNAISDGCLQRVRYTGQPVHLPLAVRAYRNGVMIQFTSRLDREVANDAGSYSVSRWNYRYGGEYGSKDYSIRDSSRMGHDGVEVRSAYLMDDGRSVFLEIPDMTPANQMHIRASLLARDGEDVSCDVYATVHNMREAMALPAAIMDLAKGDRTNTPAPMNVERGLLLEMTHRSTGQKDARHARTAAMYVSADSPVSPFLDPGPFTAKWTGYLDLPHRDDMTFVVRGRGGVKLEIDGRVVVEGQMGEQADLLSEPVRMRAGLRALALTYDAPASGDAQVRLYWKGSGFSLETIGPMYLMRESLSPVLVAGEQRRDARRMFAQSMCIRCHVPEAGHALPESAMPELSDEAPSLRAVGARLQSSWLSAWVEGKDHTARQTCPLSNKITTGEAGHNVDARDMSAFLVSLKGDVSVKEKAADGVSLERGQALFNEIGCAACHIPPVQVWPADDERSPMGSVSSKWRGYALAAYLEGDDSIDVAHAPRLQLGPEEAESLAGYLMASPVDEPAPFRDSDGDAVRGRSLVRQAGCAACHALPVENALDAPTLGSMRRGNWLHKGCVAPETHRGSAPRLPLRDNEKHLLANHEKNVLESITRTSPIEYAHRAMERLQCVACHERDGAPSRWSQLPHGAQSDDDEGYGGEGGASIQFPPPITLAGDKLRADWLQDLFMGKRDQRVRPWLKVRMPVFQESGSLLAKGIAFDHGRSIEPDPIDPASDVSVDVGRSLLGDSGGLGCVTCHSVGDEPARMQLAFGVINFEHTAQRLRPEYFMRWMLNPQRIDPLSPMPAFADGTGRTALATQYAGDARRQFEAIRLYLHERFEADRRITPRSPSPARSNDRPTR